MKRFFDFSRKIDAKLSRSVGKELLFGGVSAKSYVGINLCDTINNTINKDQRI
jgi:hypothetical protein